MNWSPIPDVGTGDESWVLNLWRRGCREPALMFSAAYVLVGFLGLWSSAWFYHGFGISIADYLQASDYLVAGLRDPGSVLIFAIGVLLARRRREVSWALRQLGRSEASSAYDAKGQAHLLHTRKPLAVA